MTLTCCGLPVLEHLVERRPADLSEVGDLALRDAGVQRERKQGCDSGCLGGDLLAGLGSAPAVGREGSFDLRWRHARSVNHLTSLRKCGKLVYTQPVRRHLMTPVHTVTASWVDTDGTTGHETFASVDGDLYYSFGHEDPEDISAEWIEERAEGDGNFKPMGYCRSFFEGLKGGGSFAAHVEFHDPEPVR